MISPPYDAVCAVGQSSQNRVLTMISDCLHGVDEDVRFDAAGALGQLGVRSPEVVASLLKALRDKVRNVHLRSSGTG